MIRAAYLILCLFLYQLTAAQHVVTFQVKNQHSDPLIGALILSNTALSLITDQTGTAAGSVNVDTLIYQISYLGYKTKVDTLLVADDLLIGIILEESEETLADVVISANTMQRDLKSNTGVKSFGVEDVKGLPYLLGEQDPIKFIQTQPGVSTGTDGNNGYYVRGGGIDQNKIELDHIELYNANHMFGFFSMFNVSAVDHIDYYKSGSPAHIGGRISSTMQIHTITPNLEKLEGKAGLGLLSANLTLQTPLQKGKSSLLFAGRKSYFDLVTQNVIGEDSRIGKRTDYRFSDFIVKYHHRPSENHRISITAFNASDDYDYRGSDTYRNLINWRTSNIGLQWNWIISDSRDLQFYLNGGTYTQQFGAEIVNYDMQMQSDIVSWKGGVLLNHAWQKHQLSYGVEVMGRKLKPNEVDISSGEQTFTLAKEDYISMLESSIFLDDNFQINEKVQLAAGLRVTGYAQLGPFTRYHSTENFVVLDTSSYQKGELVKTYLAFEPRLRANYLIDRNQSIRFSYDRNYQFIHLSPLSSVSLPTDVWVPSSGLIKPQNAHQITLSYHRIWNNVKLSLATYGKWMGNQLEYRNGAIVGYSSGNNFDDAFIFGKGRSKGIELFLQKEHGTLQYQLSYTLSKTERSLNEIQNGDFFPAKYDRTHDLNLVGSYQLEQWTFSGLFKLATGSAITLPTAKYVIDGNIISEYSDRNSFRMPTYHRLDLAATLVPQKHPNAKWIFSVYNVYNRSNPYYMYFDVKGNVNEYRLDINLRKVSLFPVLPSINYELSF